MGEKIRLAIIGCGGMAGGHLNACKELKEKKVRLIDQEPRAGAGGAKIAFIHPKETNGVLVEICERD